MNTWINLSECSTSSSIALINNHVDGRNTCTYRHPFDYKITFLKIGVIIGVLAPINALFRIETPFNMPLSTSAKVGKPESFPKVAMLNYLNREYVLE